jgi:hypothetical protein
MMRKGIYIIWAFIFALTACRDGEVKPLFDKSADERTAEAVANFKADLVAPANGYKLKYKPNDTAGSFYVFMKFNEDNTVYIRTDLAVDNGKYFNDTLTYRIDSSLGLELIMETNCFFGFLYELDQATFGAEYEFNYVSKTPDNALVFVSKTDPIEPRTRLVFQPATANEGDAHLSAEVATNLSIMANDFDAYAQPYQLTYDSKDLIVYLSIDDLRRTVSIFSVSRKSNINQTAVFAFETPYILDHDSVVFEKPLQGTYVGLNVSLRSFRLDNNSFAPSSLAVCSGSKPAHTYAGKTSAGEAVTLTSTYYDPAGAVFATLGNYFSAPLGNILLNGEQAYEQLQNDLTGVTHFQIYNGGNDIMALGFRLENTGAQATFALWEYTLTRTGNKLTYNLASDITLFGNPNPDADINKVKQYILDLTSGGNLYVFKLGDMVYEFHNPCTGWSYIMIGANI